MHHTENADGIPDLGPDVYRRWRASNVGIITERLERQLLLDLVGDLRGRKILDLGCGDGTFAIELARCGAIVTGIDTSMAMIEAAKVNSAQSGVDVDFQVAAAESLPFASAHFDVATAITVLCFVDDAASVFREAARVLKPEGRFVVGELGKWSIWAAGRRIRAWLGSQLWRHGHFRTASELRRLAEQAGLSVRAVRGAIFYPRCGLLARLIAPFDPALGRLTTLGAGFVAVLSIKATR